MKLIIGVILLILAFSVFSGGMNSGNVILGLILLIISVNSLIDAFEINLQVNMTSGKINLIDFFIFDKSKAETAEKEINNIISNRLTDTNNREQTDRIIDAINNK